MSNSYERCIVSGSATQTVESIDRAVHALYLCAYQEGGWQAFLRPLVELFDGKAATFGVHVTCDRASNFQFSFSTHVRRGIMVDPLYTDTYSALDPFVGLPSSRPVTFRRFVPAETLRSCGPYLTYMTRRNVGDILGVDIVEPGAFEARLRISRCRDQERFAPADETLCQRLVPHLQSAAALYIRHQQLIAERALATDVASNLSLAALFIDGEGHISYMTRHARELMARLPLITISDGTLILPDPLITARLKSAIGDALRCTESHTSTAPILVTAVHGANTIAVEIHTLPGDPEPCREFKAALVLRVAGCSHLPSVAEIQRSMRITMSEAKLAQQLAAGMSVAEAAVTLGVCQSTVRSQLKSIFRKAGLHRQAEVVRAVLQRDPRHLEGNHANRSSRP